MGLDPGRDGHAPADGDHGGPAPAAWTDGDAARIARDDAAAWNAHDADEARSYVAEDVTCFDVAVGEPKQDPEIPATGKPFAIDGVTSMRIESGKIVHRSDCHDGLGFQKQLGWID